MLEKKWMKEGKKSDKWSWNISHNHTNNTCTYTHTPEKGANQTSRWESVERTTTTTTVLISLALKSYGIRCEIVFCQKNRKKKKKKTSKINSETQAIMWFRVVTNRFYEKDVPRPKYTNQVYIKGTSQHQVYNKLDELTISRKTQVWIFTNLLRIIFSKQVYLKCFKNKIYWNR